MKLHLSNIFTNQKNVFEVNPKEQNYILSNIPAYKNKIEEYIPQTLVEYSSNINSNPDLPIINETLDNHSSRDFTVEIENLIKEGNNHILLIQNDHPLDMKNLIKYICNNFKNKKLWLNIDTIIKIDFIDLLYSVKHGLNGLEKNLYNKLKGFDHSKTLFILENFDENIPEYRYAELSKYPNIIVTSSIENSSQANSVFKFNRVLKDNGLSHANAQKFLANRFNNLKPNINLTNISPSLLEMMCYIILNNPEYNLQEARITDIYSNVYNLLLKNYNGKEKDLSLIASSMNEYAYQKLKSPYLKISEETKKTAKIQKFGLIYTNSLENGLSFIDPNFQSFFAAQYIKEELLNNNKIILDKLALNYDSHNYSKTMIFLSGILSMHKYDRSFDKHNIITSFWGVLSEQNSQVIKIKGHKYFSTLIALLAESKYDPFIPPKLEKLANKVILNELNKWGLQLIKHQYMPNEIFNILFYRLKFSQNIEERIQAIKILSSVNNINNERRIEIKDVLIALIHSDDLRILEATFGGLINYIDFYDVKETLIEKLNDNNNDVVILAIENLSRVMDDQILSHLYNKLDDRNIWVQFAAIEAISSTNFSQEAKNDALEILVSKLNFTDCQNDLISNQIIEGILKLTDNPEDFTNLLISWLKDDVKSSNAIKIWKILYSNSEKNLNHYPVKPVVKALINLPITSQNLELLGILYKLTSEEKLKEKIINIIQSNLKQKLSNQNIDLIVTSIKILDQLNAKLNNSQINLIFDIFLNQKITLNDSIRKDLIILLRKYFQEINKYGFGSKALDYILESTSINHDEDLILTALDTLIFLCKSFLKESATQKYIIGILLENTFDFLSLTEIQIKTLEFFQITGKNAPFNQIINKIKPSTAHKIKTFCYNFLEQVLKESALKDAILDEDTKTKIVSFLKTTPKTPVNKHASIKNSNDNFIEQISATYANPKQKSISDFDLDKISELYDLIISKAIHSNSKTIRKKLFSLISIIPKQTETLAIDNKIEGQETNPNYKEFKDLSDILNRLNEFCEYILDNDIDITITLHRLSYANKSFNIEPSDRNSIKTIKQALSKNNELEHIKNEQVEHIFSDKTKTYLEDKNTQVSIITPISYPTTQPSGQPSGQPSAQPNVQPSAQPSAQPNVQPSAQPSVQPFAHPSSQPSLQPTVQPTGKPSRQPSGQPSRQPSGQPSRQPSVYPTTQPSAQPSMHPSRQPISHPSVQPSSQPSRQPISYLTSDPTSQPSALPSGQPSSQPSAYPTAQPSSQPTNQPTAVPTVCPTVKPSGSQYLHQQLSQRGNQLCNLHLRQHLSQVLDQLLQQRSQVRCQRFWLKKFQV